MAILQIKGQTQGTGIVTFTMPNTNENATVTLPAKTGTVALTSDIVDTDTSNLATKEELSSGLEKKADKVHTHTIANVTNLQSTLDGKALKSHTHAEGDITDLTAKLGTLATKTELGKKLDATAKAVSAASADKATSDAKGNVIDTTYLSNVTAASTYATIATTYTKEQVDAKVTSVYRYKGTVASKTNLPSQSNVIGDVYNVTDTDKNFAWDGKQWDDLGGTVDLTAYAKTVDVDAKLAKKLDTSAAFTKTTADGLYLGKTAKAVSATTADSATSATKATQDASGNVITTTYATKSEVSAKAPIANPTFTGTVTGTFKGNVTGNATSATKATQDGTGAVITTTYATKTELNAKAPLANPTFTGTVTISGGTFKGNLTGTADAAKSASAVAWNNVSGKPGLIPTSGNAGTITTSETIANLQTVNATSPRSMKASSGATVTLEQGGSEAWITVVACEGAVTVNLGGGWSWSGSMPTLGKGLLTCAWYGSFGIVNFMKWGS